MKRFHEFTVVDENTLGQVGRWLDLRAADMGPELASFRAVPGWLGTVTIFLAPAVLLLGLFVAPDAVGRWIAVGVYLLLVGALGLFWVRGWMEKHRVCRHGLVLGLRRQYVVPWSTIDPGRVRLVRRANFIRHHGILPGPLLRPAETLGHALLVNGLDSTPHGQLRLIDNEDLREEGRPARASLSCFDRWFLAGRHAPEVVRAMEEAMVADGYPAGGMADAVLAQPIVMQWKPRRHPGVATGDHLSPGRATTDPVLGVDGRGNRPQGTNR